MQVVKGINMLALVLAVVVIAGLIALAMYPKTRKFALAVGGGLLIAAVVLGLYSMRGQRSLIHSSPIAFENPVHGPGTANTPAEEFPRWRQIVLPGLGVALLALAALLGSNQSSRPWAMTVLAGIGVLAAVGAVALFAKRMVADADRRFGDQRLVQAQLASTVKQSSNGDSPPSGPKPEPTAKPVVLPAVPGANAAPPAITSEESAKAPVAEAEPSPRPAWVDAKPQRINDSYQLTVSSGLFSNEEECDRALDVMVKIEADAYLNRWHGEGTAELANFSASELRSMLKRGETYWETAPDGRKKQAFARLEFDNRARAEILARLRDVVVTDRLKYIGLVVAGVLALVGTAFGYLRLDLATSGAYRQRLQLAAAGAILLMVGGAMLVA